MEINKASAVVLYGTEGIKAATGRFFCYSDKLRLAHQTSAESTALYALGRTPNLFSNTNAAHVAHIKANYQVFGHAHAAYLSHELGLVKPDATSFLKLLEIEGLPPEDCIFIDDRAENTAAAAALGMRTVTFTGRDAFLADLDRYGVTLEL